MPLQKLRARRQRQWRNSSWYLRKSRKLGGSKSKKVVGKLVEKRRLSIAKKSKRTGKSKNVVVKENEMKLLIKLLLKEPVDIVISYFDDGTNPFIVSTHAWILEEGPEIAVDKAGQCPFE